MNDRSSIIFLRDRLSTLTGVTHSSAGESIRQAMAAGEIEAVADGVSVRADTADTATDLILEKHALKPDYWQHCRIDWDSRYPSFTFYIGRDQYFASDITVDAVAAATFLRLRDPLNQSQPSASAAVEKNRGGRPTKYDWDGAFIEMARIAVLGDDSSRAALTKAVEDWFMQTSGSSPASSLVREKVQRFHESIWPPRG
ncbi:hypothetical protein [Methylobacterium sp. WL19]|uniref:hypothetical protein n=1 Tax=Methylobacterium sp. WL19 TaxID=2603896 RepID=UPI0011C8BAFD|nr:hypothetical protein [Methylobacterium sp. WL19]TXN27129.1 hypothetical protein FV220_12455 [Methylobacterium sp. WL19]